MITGRFSKFVKLFFSFVLISEGLAAITVVSDIPVASTSAGILRGKLIKTAATSYYAFKGIPYAEPPVRALRFEPPVKKSSWIGARESLENETRCLTLGGITENANLIFGTEDCLYLNVYVPSKKTFLMRAVMLFIAGNMFTTEPEYGPEHLVKNEVIVVTLSYRSSVFGFLSNEDEQLSGNQGLKDITMALKWVQTNIEVFMGNPRKVTLFGQSNGAALVNYLLLSNSSAGLFSKAIMQSGCALMPHMFQPTPREMTKLLMSKLELTFTSTKEMLEKLKVLDAEKILNAVAVMRGTVSPFLLKPLDFVPSIESKFTKEPFLTESPLTKMASGKFHIIPIMIGSNAHEALFLNNTLANFTEINNNSPNSIVPLSFELPENSTKINSTILELQKFYFNGRPNGTASEWLQIYSDYIFKFPIDRIARFYTAKSHLPLYYYEFAYDGAANYYRNLFNLTATTTTHSDEIPYLFESKAMKLTLDAKATIMRERMTALWANFAKDGDPTLRATTLLNAVWLEYRSHSRSYYEISSVLNNRKDFSRMNSLSALQKKLTGHF